MAMTKYQRRQKELRRKLREDEKFFRDSAQLSINVLSVVPVYIMLEQYGWKRIRPTAWPWALFAYSSRLLTKSQAPKSTSENRALTTPACTAAAVLGVAVTGGAYSVSTSP